MKTDKASTGDKPTTIMKQSDFSYKALTKCIIKESIEPLFSGLFQITNAAPVYKAKYIFDKTNCRTIGNLPLILKVLKYMKNLYLNKYLFMLTNSSVKYYMVAEKLIVHGKPYLDYCIKLN